MIAQRTLIRGLQLGLLALAALFAATTVNGFIAGALQTRPAFRLAEPPPPAPTTARHPLSYYAPITERDIFNPPRPEAEAPSASPVAELKARLLGTAPGHGMDSFAIIEDQSSKKQELYRIGDQLQGRKVARIEWDRVMLKNGPREEILKIIEASGTAPSAAAVTATAGSGIQSLGDLSYVIDRSEVDRSMENLNQLFTQIRAVPHFQDGKASGFRLFAIRRDSIFEKIGLKNGDIVSRINGNELTDPARAMAMIQELRGENRITVELSRNREPTTMTYEIR